MTVDANTAKRELVARVATLELLVADLIELLWQTEPEIMRQLSRDAAHDLDIQHARFMPGGAENQRERLFAVLRDRVSRLEHRRRPPERDADVHDGQTGKMRQSAAETRG